MNENMKKAREAAGFSQKQVSITLHVSAPTVSDWESGKICPSAANLKALSKLYNVPSDYLLGENGDYIASSGTEIRTEYPLSILAVQYDVSTDVMSDILGVDKSKAEKIILRLEKPEDQQLQKAAKVFKVSLDSLKHGIIPLRANSEVMRDIFTRMVERYPHR